MEDIMGASALQAFIISFLMEVIIEAKLKKKYTVLVNEAGLHLDKNSNLSGDILIYDPTIMTAEKLPAGMQTCHPKCRLKWT